MFVHIMILRVCDYRNLESNTYLDNNPQVPAHITACLLSKFKSTVINCIQAISMSLEDCMPGHSLCYTALLCNMGNISTNEGRTGDRSVDLRAALWFIFVMAPLGTNPIIVDGFIERSSMLSINHVYKCTSITYSINYLFGSPMYFLILQSPKKEKLVLHSRERIIESRLAYRILLETLVLVSILFRQIRVSS